MVTRTGIDFIKEHPPSSRRAANAHRALALDGFDSRDSIYEKSPSPFGEELRLSKKSSPCWAFSIFYDIIHMGDENA